MKNIFLLPLNIVRTIKSFFYRRKLFNYMYDVMFEDTTYLLTVPSVKSIIVNKITQAVLDSTQHPDTNSVTLMSGCSLYQLQTIYLGFQQNKIFVSHLTATIIFAELLKVAQSHKIPEEQFVMQILSGWTNSIMDAIGSKLISTVMMELQQKMGIVEGYNEDLFTFIYFKNAIEHQMKQ